MARERPRRTSAVLLAVVAMALAGCGSTKQYLIATGQNGDPVVQPRAKLRLDGCANCYLWGRDGSPANKRRALEASSLYVDIGASDRCFLWVFLVPIPGWKGCSPTVEYAEQPELYLTLGNTGEQSIELDPGSIRVTRQESELAASLAPTLPLLIPPGGEISVALRLQDWSAVGWGYDLQIDLADSEAARIHIDRFTTTTFGFMLLD